MDHCLTILPYLPTKIGSKDNLGRICQTEEIIYLLCHVLLQTYCNDFSVTWHMAQY